MREPGICPGGGRESATHSRPEYSRGEPSQWAPYRLDANDYGVDCQILQAGYMRTSVLVTWVFKLILLPPLVAVARDGGFIAPE
jgi:hypothetical protein